MDKMLTQVDISGKNGDKWWKKDGQKEVKITCVKCRQKVDKRCRQKVAKNGLKIWTKIGQKIDLSRY